MATYPDLFELHREEPLRDRVAVAVSITAQKLLDAASPTPAQVTWAREALANPLSKTDLLFRYVLAKNNGLTVEQIKTATDAAIQAQIDAAVDIIIAGGV